jgi:hypothetical protein
MDRTPLEQHHVAPQQNDATIKHEACRPLWKDRPAWVRPRVHAKPMTSSAPRQLLIRGTTRDGRAFRPSDWAERLAGAMSSFRPDGGSAGIAAYIGYSPYCVPRVIDGVRSVIVDEALRSLEPMAWDFVMNFARDNDLVVEEVGAAPDRVAAA